ncbi:MAG: hypothetical protein HY319_00535 [Armatimonadetes bacterium]|nr:hypothetical protein [Armatimonadota bacterium]
MLSNIFGPQGPQRFQLLPSSDGAAWIDVDKNGRIDESDAYVSLKTPQGSENLDFADLMGVLKARPQATGAEVAADLGRLYKEEGFQGTGVVNGGMCFDMLSEYRQKQTFELQGGKVFYTLEPDPNAPVQAYEEPAPSQEGTTQVSLVRDEDGVLRWKFPEPEAPPPLPPGAVTEATCVDRDGVLHWLFPGDVPEPGDTIIGNTDNFAENLAKRHS